MMEQGQPMHAFDAALLSGGINVRRAVDGETLTLLNDQTVALDEAVLVIADDARVLALAGIMGGLGSGVEMTTKDVFLEAAFFHPDAIAGRARRFGLATDSSFRFERGVDFAATRRAMERATQLLLEICGGSAGKITEVSGQMPVRAQIKLRVSRVARVLGIPLESGQIADLLRRLQFDFEMSGDHFLVAPPSFRFDLSIEADLVEEVARLYGYDHIPALVPHAALTMLPYSESQRPLAHLQQLMVARDYQEIVSYAFVDEQVERELCGNLNPLLLQNPIASNLAVMRSSLLGGLIGALRFNLNRKQSRVRLFEAGACFAKSGNDYVQTQRLSGIAYGGISHEQWGMESRSVDFYDVKSDLEALFSPHELRFVAAAHPALHPGRSAQICFGDRVVGWIGELHPQWQQQYDMAQSAVWFEVELESLGGAAVPRLNEIPRFLPVRRDLAVLVDESVNVQVLMDVMLQAQLAYVQEVVLFDVYRGRGVEPGKKSLAFRLSLQDTQKTLTDAEIEPVIAQMVEVLNRQGAQLRM
jgi:phenylalanyl-tRNA synthetase beta chain